ncbi:hypothetical protein TWF481_006906 [Arthrobotrys musiformis]|uniref:F-box domain-containing protein n=1 Tax=Arthrobotrys musiformis TaxID=47236 RepID=A0AAV9WBX6_9PEZI
MPHILELPDEVTDLILDELGESPDWKLKLADEVTDLTLDELGESPDWKLKLMLTCRHFRQLVLPRFYATCGLGFGRGVSGPVSVLCDRSARTIWRLHQANPQYGQLVKVLDIEFGRRYIAKGPVSNETSDFETTRSVQSVFGQLLPRFDNLRTVKLRRFLIPMMNSVGFRNIYYTLRAVLSCSSLKELSIDISLLTDLMRDSYWETEVQEASHNLFCANYGDPLANLDKLEIRLHEKKFYSRDFDESAVPSLMGILADMLEQPCRSLGSLLFKYEVWSFGHASARRRDHFEFIPEVRVGGRLRLPRLKTLMLSMGDGGRRLFEQYFDFDFRGIKSLSLADLPVENSLGLDFLQKFTGLSTFHVRLSSDTDLESWCANATSLRKACPSLRKVAIFGYFDAEDPIVGGIVKKYCETHNARIERFKVPQGFAVSNVDLLFGFSVSMLGQAIQDDDSKLYFYHPYAA